MAALYDSAFVAIYGNENSTCRVQMGRFRAERVGRHRSRRTNIGLVSYHNEQ